MSLEYSRQRMLFLLPVSNGKNKNLLTAAIDNWWYALKDWRQPHQPAQVTTL